MLLEESLAALEPGTVISGKYRVERMLGRGGMGVVVAATHLELQQVFAIKMLLPSAARSAEATTRFLREGRSAARLTSPHVTKVHDTGRLETGEPYLVMELLRGIDLREHLANVGRVPLAQAVDWTLQAAHALSEAHALHVIHRDVKPANLFLADTSAGQRLKILDFGISKLLDEGALDLTSTASGVGTPRYMAPEQMRSARLADARGDVWSLGVVLYELTTGQSPFHGDSVTALCFDVMERTPVAPSQLVPELPQAFDAIMARCLEKDPDERYPSIEAFAVALHALAPPSRASGFFEAWLEPTISESAPSRPGAPMAADVPAAPGSYPGAIGRPPTVQVPFVASPLAGPPVHEPLGAWNTQSVPHVEPARSRPVPLVAIGLGVGITAAVLTGMLLLGRGRTPPAQSGHVVASAPAPPAPLRPPVASSGPLVTVSDAPVSSAIGSATTPSSTAALQSSGKGRIVPRPNCNPPFTVDNRGIRIPKPQCLD